MIIPGRPDELTPLTVQMLPKADSADIMSTSYDLTSSESKTIPKHDSQSQKIGVFSLTFLIQLSNYTYYNYSIITEVPLHTDVQSLSASKLTSTSSSHPANSSSISHSANSSSSVSHQANSSISPSSSTTRTVISESSPYSSFKETTEVSGEIFTSHYCSEISTIVVTVLY